jgi:galactonate dehydratase
MGAMLSAPATLLAQAGGQPRAAGKGEPAITAIRTYDAGRLVIEVVSSEGVSGWGEVNTLPSAAIGRPVAEAYAPLLVGMNPMRIEQAWQLMFRAHRNLRGGMIHSSVIGGIDMALWDLTGKLLNVPVYTLLGGPVRTHIRRYPSQDAFKQTTHQLHEMVETPIDLDRVVNDLQKTRERVGPNGALMFDGHGKFTAQAAIQLCRKIEAAGIDLLYFEEVVPPENLADLKRVKQATAVPLCTGERLATMYPFRQVFEARSADVLNPDIVRIGGITQMKKLATIAELYDIPIAPHGTHSAIGTAASLHVCAAVNNFLIHEAYDHIVKRANWASGVSFDDPRGFKVEDLNGPGIGVTIDRDGLAEAVARQAEKPQRGINKAYFAPDGGVADR